jgi:hypothetical protein
MSRDGWDDFGQDEPVRHARPEAETPQGEGTLRSGDELGAELDHWISVFEEQMDSSIDEGWVRLHLEIGQLLNLLATLRAAGWVLRAKSSEDCPKEREP